MGQVSFQVPFSTSLCSKTGCGLFRFAISDIVHFGFEEVSLSNEPRHEISNNVVCATSTTSDQPAHTRSLIRAFTGRLSSLCLLSY